ncbi:MAG: hypothetical protein Q7R50_04050 [Dehalococcoidales bacterium]|nr:hypothetical protein [Dehalococcoidales bacterium]
MEDMKGKICLVTGAEVKKVTGKYFSNEMAEKSSPESYDEAVASRLPLARS